MRFSFIQPGKFSKAKLASSLALALSLSFGMNAHAAPAANDEMEAWLADKGLFSQVAQVGQSVSVKASELVVNAMGFLGVPYKRGGNTVETGFDCSGLVRSIYEQTLGLVLPRRASSKKTWVA